MKRKKEWQSIAEESLDGLRNEEFKVVLLAERAKLNTENESAKQTVRKKTSARRWVLSVVGTLAIALAVIVPCVLFLVPAETEEGVPLPPHYGWTNELDTVATLEEINAVLVGYDIIPDYVQSVSLVVDGKTGDRLYYDVSWENFEAMKGCRIMILVNPYYEPFEMTTDSEMTVAGLDIAYAVETHYDAEYDVYAFSGYGETMIAGVRVLFRSYDCLSETSDNGFAEFIISAFAVE